MNFMKWLLPGWYKDEQPQCQALSDAYCGKEEAEQKNKDQIRRLMEKITQLSNETAMISKKDDRR